MDDDTSCYKCWEHVASLAEHYHNEKCRPPFCTGGGTSSGTLEFQESLKAAANDLHERNCCLVSGCEHTPRI